MTSIPQKVHFIGIGGIGMSGIAQILLEKNIIVTGSDANQNKNTIKLESCGAKVFLGNSADNLGDAQVVVVSTAIKSDNPELMAAKSMGIPVLHRSEMLDLIMKSGNVRICVSGTHGKTTTTAMIALGLEAAHLNPTVINGGIINHYQSNAKVGDLNTYVIEADESDGSFTNFTPTISVVTNIDPEHMDYYKTEERIYEAFQKFCDKTQEFVVACGDHTGVKKLISKIDANKVVTYGLDSSNDYYALNVSMNHEGIRFDLYNKGALLKSDVFLKAFGLHNLLNSMAALAIAHRMGCLDAACLALATYDGVERRFSIVGSFNGATILDDYAHHPVEVEATLQAARQVCSGKLIAVLQPHRYTRVRDHMEEFAASCGIADLTIVLPIYSAGESPIDSINHVNLSRKMKGQVEVCEDPDQLTCSLYNHMGTGDMVLCMGAGNISQIARSLEEGLEKVKREEKVCA